MPDYAFRPERKRSRSLPLGILLAVSVVAIAAAAFNLYRSRQVFVSPLPSDPTPPANTLSFVFNQKKREPEDLKNIIVSIIGDYSKDYSVLVKDFNSDFTVAIDDSVIYMAASVNKVPILSALYTKIQSQDVDPDKVITMQPNEIQDYGTGSMRYDPPGTRYSVRTMAKLMMKQSDNTAAYIIANEIVGLKDIQDLVTGWGLTQTDMYDNKTSNKDMELLFEKIFKGKLVSQALTEEIRALMSDSLFEDRLPALLPDEATVYHKIGTEVGVVHDVGVVVSPKSTYYIGVMIGDSADDEQSAETIAKVSKAVYDFMQ